MPFRPGLYLKLHVAVKLRKPLTLEIFLEHLLCLERKPVRCERGNPQTVTVIYYMCGLCFCLWFDFASDWSQNDKHSTIILSVHGFHSLIVMQ